MWARRAQAGMRKKCVYLYGNLTLVVESCPGLAWTSSALAMPGHEHRTFGTIPWECNEKTNSKTCKRWNGMRMKYQLEVL